MKTPKQADNRPLFKRVPKRIADLWDKAHGMLRQMAREEWAANQPPKKP